jgi:hypothetical protein
MIECLAVPPCPPSSEAPSLYISPAIERRHILPSHERVRGVGKPSPFEEVEDEINYFFL